LYRYNYNRGIIIQENPPFIAEELEGLDGSDNQLSDGGFAKER
jgi:hypothetical protein